MNGRTRTLGVTLALVLILLGSATGCWNRREPENLAHALGIGFDIDEVGNYKAYVQLSNPEGAGGSGKPPEKGTSPASSAWTVSAIGRTPYEAIANTVPFVSRELSVAHVGIIVISERLARQGISPILDALERERTLRTTTRIMVARGDVGKVMSAKVPMEEVTSQAISRGMPVSERERSIVPVKYTTDVIDTLSQPGKEPLLAQLTVLDELSNTSSEVSADGKANEETNPKPPLKLAGAAVFRGDRMVGWMDERETRGWAWLANSVHRAVMVIDLPEAGEGEYTTVIVSQASSKLRPKIDGGNIRFELKVLVDGRIEDQTAPTDFFDSRENVASMNSRVATAIKHDVEKALRTAQSLRADVFGLGWMLYRTKYKEWQKVEGRWDDIFPQVSVEMDIRVDVRRSGLVTKAGAKR